MQAIYPHILVGLINGSFCALLGLVLAVIFVMLNSINFAQGARYRMGAFVAYFILEYAGLSSRWVIESAARRKSLCHVG